MFVLLSASLKQISTSYSPTSNNQNYPFNAAQAFSCFSTGSCICTLQIEDCGWGQSSSRLLSYPMTVMSLSAVRAAEEECDDDDQGQQWRELSWAALPSVIRSSSDIRHFFFLPKMCPPALMGCRILIWLHKKKIWAFILFRKQHSSFTKAFSVSLPETGNEQLFLLQVGICGNLRGGKSIHIFFTQVEVQILKKRRLVKMEVLTGSEM